MGNNHKEGFPLTVVVDKNDIVGRFGYVILEAVLDGGKDASLSYPEIIF